MLTDPISDMLTRIRNGGRARMARVSMPSSRLKREIARVLKQEGYIRDFSVTEDRKPVLTIEVRYGRHSQPMIEGLERVSKPSRRVYLRSGEVPQIRRGLGVAILSTPRGILTDREAREAGVGGEVLAKVW